MTPPKGGRLWAYVAATPLSLMDSLQYWHELELGEDSGPDTTLHNENVSIKLFLWWDCFLAAQTVQILEW